MTTSQAFRMVAEVGGSAYSDAWWNWYVGLNPGCLVLFSTHSGSDNLTTALQLRVWRGSEAVTAPTPVRIGGLGGLAVYAVTEFPYGTTQVEWRFTMPNTGYWRGEQAIAFQMGGSVITGTPTYVANNHTGAAGATSPLNFAPPAVTAGERDLVAFFSATAAVQSNSRAWSPVAGASEQQYYYRAFGSLGVEVATRLVSVAGDHQHTFTYNTAPATPPEGLSVRFTAPPQDGPPVSANLYKGRANQAADQGAVA